MSLYEDNKDQAPVVDPAGEQPQGDQGPNGVDQLLVGIKNERGEQKYANVEEALKGLAHAQDFINTLKTEKAQLEGQVKSQSELAEMLKPKVEPAKPAEQITDPVAGMTQEQVLAIVEQREQAKIEKGNMARVSNALQSKFGAEYKEALVAKTKELGLTPGLVDNMAKETPDALIKLFGLDSQEPTKPSVQSSVNPEKLTGEKPAPRKFDPFAKTKSNQVDAWLESKKRTNARLGLTG